MEGCLQIGLCGCMLWMLFLVTRLVSFLFLSLCEFGKGDCGCGFYLCGTETVDISCFADSIQPTYWITIAVGITPPFLAAFFLMGRNTITLLLLT